MTNEQAKATHEEWHAAKGGPPITIYAYHEASDGTRHVYNVAHVFTQVAAKRIANLPALEASHAALLKACERALLALEHPMTTPGIRPTVVLKQAIAAAQGVTT